MKRIWEYLKRLEVHFMTETAYFDTAVLTFPFDADAILRDFKRLPSPKEVEYAIWVMQGRPHRVKDESFQVSSIADPQASA